MADQTARLEAATVRAEVGSSILYRFSNDGVSEDPIPTASGDITNLKKVILDIQTEGANKISFATQIYATTAAGIAATTSGAIFLVRSSDPDEIYAVYSNNSGTAVDTGKRALSAAAVQAATDSATAAAAAAQDAATTATARVAGLHSPAASDPATRDDGTALQIGDTYFNTALQAGKIFSSSGWILASVTGAQLNSAINTREPTLPAGVTGQYLDGDKTFKNLNKGAVDLGNVDNTSDLNKPVSTAVTNALNGKEPSIAIGTTGQYFRGDKTFQTLNKIAVGLVNVDNTSDANKPISTAQQGALDLKTSIASLAATTGSGLIGRPGSGTLNDLFTATEALGSNIVPFTAPGGAGNGAQSSTLQTRLAKLKFVSDYDTLVHGLGVSPNMSLRDPDGITYKNTVNQQLAVFGLAPSASWIASEVLRSTTTGAHPDVSRIAYAVELSPAGSGKNGPQSADYVMNLCNTKTNWTTTTQTGEIDGLSIMVRQGGKFTGGIASDAAGILVNVGNVTGSGWLATYESVTQNYADDGTGNNILRSVQNAIGVLDSVTGNYHGFTTTANKGTLGSAFYADRIEGQGSWSNFLNYIANGKNMFRVDTNGYVVLNDGLGTATSTKTLRANSGSFNILNHAQSANILTLSDTGAMNIGSNLDSGGVLVVRGAAASAGTNTVVYGGTVASTATAGGIAKPATYAGYVVLNINGTQVKMPYYAN